MMDAEAKLLAHEKTLLAERQEINTRLTAVRVSLRILTGEPHRRPRFRPPVHGSVSARTAAVLADSPVPLKTQALTRLVFKRVATTHAERAAVYAACHRLRKLGKVVKWPTGWMAAPDVRQRGDNALA